MGVVYRGRDTDLNRDVAVKFLREKYAPHSLAARRFLDEARITGQLQHPGIPPVHEVGTLPDGRPFLVMKLIKGRTLDDILTDGSATRGFLVTAFEQVCQAVGYAHNRGVIHRDLKPHNVMVGAFGEVQVMDWGLAKFRGVVQPEETEASIASTFHDPREEDEALRTRTGSFLGTPAYMAPEQAHGAVDRIDERTDVFGLGGVLCSILVGRPPFVGDTPESTRQLAARGELADCFAQLDACEAEPELVALCKRCLAVEQADRPANAAAVAKAVAEFRHTADERARQAELDRVRAEGERAKAEAEMREQQKRRRVQLALAAAVMLLLAGGGCFAWWRAEIKAEQARVDGERLAEDARRAEQESNRLTQNASALADHVKRCEYALQADDAETAASALTEIDRRMSEGGGEEFASRVNRCRTDLALLRELDKVDQFRWTPVEGQLPKRSTVVEKWRVVFAAAGLDVKALPADEAVQRITASLLHRRLAATLDTWLVFAPSAEVREVLRRADENPYRDAVRDAIAAKDLKRLVKLAGQAEALAQPVGFAAASGQHSAIPVERRRAVLELALRSRPGDLTLLLTLSSTYPTNQKDGAAERVRWLQAAVAVHPRHSAIHSNLGDALRNKGELDGAIAALQRAVELEPKLGNAHTNLGLALADKGDADGAIAAYKRAIELGPIGALARNNLAWLLATGPDRVRNGKQAVEHATHACELTAWKVPIFIHTLGAAYAEAGDFAKAIEYTKKALTFPEVEKMYGNEVRQHLELYTQKKPYRDPVFLSREAAPPPREAKP
jgi:tetratricopeptide (TPR) repeat protein